MDSCIKNVRNCFPTNMPSAEQLTNATNYAPHMLAIEITKAQRGRRARQKKKKRTMMTTNYM